jgi:glucose-6-phosphate 1-epimerase
MLNFIPFGAHLLSWTVDESDVLYLSPSAVMDGTAPIRGGVPVCFPQFSTRGVLPKHGFARTQIWTEIKGESHPTFELQSNRKTLALWPHSFKMRMTFQEQGNALAIHWMVQNTGDTALQFTGALHTYFAVSNITSTYLYGLQGQACWDALTDQTFCEQSEALSFSGEFDRVFNTPRHPLKIKDANRTICVSQSASLTDTVVWNPGAIKSTQIADLAIDGYQQFLCVEAAQVQKPITVEAKSLWTGWQKIEVHSLTQS